MSMFMPYKDEIERESSSMYYAFKDGNEAIRIELYGDNKQKVLEKYSSNGYILKRAIEVSSGEVLNYKCIGYKNGEIIK